MLPKFSFQNDYSEGAHPRIIEALHETNLVQAVGYGEDRFCLEAAAKIRETIGSPDADVHFVSGGTQANLVFLSSCLRPFESVIAVDTGHICVHETGAIEMTGHKVNTVRGNCGKVTPAEIEQTVKGHNDEHMVRPRVVYISHSTEVGTIYSHDELCAISAACKAHGLLLYMDGARLGSALTSKASDLSIGEIARLVDAFYIGGTKNGALIGEALVLVRPELKADMRYMIKQRGALLSKGRLLGIQFRELFRDGLYFDLALHANQMAERLSAGIHALGYSFDEDSPTNQIFPIFPTSVIERMSQMYLFYVWREIDRERSAVRLVTSWATPLSAVDGFLADLKQVSETT